LLYVYALFAAEPPAIPPAVRVVRCGNLFAAVRDIAERPTIQEQALRDHDQTVRALAEFADALIPARFGSVADDDDSLAELLESREPELLRALDLVAGREQMTLRVYGDAPVARPSAIEAPGLGPGTRYLTSKIRENAIPGLIPGLDALRPHVRAERIQRHGVPPLLASVYHLIERGQSARYLSALDVAASLPVRFAASGPWPPYAFGHWENA
jgi:hypothetical protein